MSEKPTAFRDLPEESYPFTVEFFTADGTVVHTIEVSGPGAIEVPALGTIYGPVGARAIYADGTVHVTQPPKG
jgi:hypothetical protein